MSTPSAPRTLIQGGAIITMDAEVPNLATGDVLVEGDRIVAVAANIEVGDAEVIDAKDSIVLPGLVNAHHHAWLGVMRRLMPNVDDLFAYIGVVADTLGAHYRPLDMYASTKLTAVASLKPLPAMLTVVPPAAGPEDGVRLLIAGAPGTK